MNKKHSFSVIEFSKSKTFIEKLWLFHGTSKALKGFGTRNTGNFRRKENHSKKVTERKSQFKLT